MRNERGKFGVAKVPRGGGLALLRSHCELLDELVRRLPNAGGYSYVELPSELNLWIGNSSPNTLVNVIEACLSRLVSQGDEDCV